MDIKDLQTNWDRFGKTDPLWAVLTYAGKMGNRWDRDEFFDTGAKEIEEVLAYVESLGISLNKGNALDFGCAVGRLTQALARHFDTVSGVDIAPSMIDLAHQFNRHGDRVNYYLNGADNLRIFADDSFDFIITMITLQHMEPRYARNYLKEFLRVLKPGGVLVFQLPSEPERAFLRRQRIKRLLPSGVLNYYHNLRHGKLPQEENGQPGPQMEMYSIPKAEVLALMESWGATIENVRQDCHAGNWISYRYCVRKREDPT